MTKKTVSEISSAEGLGQSMNAWSLNMRHYLLHMIYALLSLSTIYKFVITEGNCHGQATILIGGRRPIGKIYPKSLKNWPNWPWRFARKYWRSIDVFHRDVLTRLCVSQARERGMGPVSTSNPHVWLYQNSRVLGGAWIRTRSRKYSNIRLSLTKQHAS